jgi:hypothetical protein
MRTGSDLLFRGTGVRLDTAFARSRGANLRCGSQVVKTSVRLRVRARAWSFTPGTSE